MENLLEIKFTGWTATPRMPFVLSGNAICLPTPTYSLLLGMIGCCLGRTIEASEINFGFYYKFDTVSNDLETRSRLEFDGKKVKTHSKGSDAYPREFHVNPELTIWLNRLDWRTFFENPIGTPALGRSQDLLKIESVKEIWVSPKEKTTISGTMIPFSTDIKAAGQLVQLAESYQENDLVGSGRISSRNKIFMSIPWDAKSLVNMPNLFETENQEGFYLHDFKN